MLVTINRWLQVMRYCNDSKYLIISSVLSTARYLIRNGLRLWLLPVRLQIVADIPRKPTVGKLVGFKLLFKFS